MNDEELNEYLAEHLDLANMKFTGLTALEMRVAKILREAYWLGHADGHDAGWHDGR